ncbi:efflux RND transporter permease subunit [Roseospirillum parvum]|uniref:Multidrug efflux pump subunit AcrB n=1 Tax=Roseospirillum parvum TaxID=83401 RepID=A0A1G8CY84_9PROT|nr:efflux RND transporter permease subunit [Roseospirillum parvum]SDH50547.1 Multidrug efflux pump subunit AcrB [Roseospirillum parvum]
MIRYFADHPTAANLLLIALLVLGLAALPELKRETFPDIPSDEVQISVIYPGATALEVEDAICQRVEESLDGILGLAETRCSAREGAATLIAEKEEGMAMAPFLDDVKSAVEGIDTFPDDVERPVVKELGQTDYVTSIALTGPMPVTHLKALAEEVKDELLAEPAIAQVSVEGFADRQIRIEVPRATLNRYGLSVQDLAQAIGEQSLDRPGGTLESAEGNLLIRFEDERRAVEGFADLVVFSGDSGGEVRLGDIATIEDRFENADNQITFNGRRAAFLRVVKNKDQDSLEAIGAVNRVVDTVQATSPAGVELTVTQDITSIVDDRLTMLSRNGLTGLLLVFAIMWLFFGLRFSFWVAAGLPVSFMGAFFVMNLLGYSIDMISMVGLLIGVGLLMDDAIVISENIAAKLRDGHSPFEAAVSGTRQVAPGVIASFLTTVCVFGSLIFLSGRMGAILGVMPAILIMVLAVSLIEAFLILPHHLVHSLQKSPERRSPLLTAVDRGFETVRHGVVEPAVAWAVRWRYLTVGLLLAALILSIGMIPAGVVKFRAFPDLEGDTVQARILLPEGTPLARTEALAQHIVQALDEVAAEMADRQPEGRRLVENVGVTYGQHADVAESGPHLATVNVDLLSAEIRQGSTDEITTRWRDKVGPVPDAISLIFTEREMGPAGRPIDIRLSGPDLEELKGASHALMDWLGHYRGVHDLSDDLRPGKPELRLSLRDGAGALGITGEMIAAQIGAAFQGVTVDEIQIGPESYEIDVRLAEADRDGLEDLDRFHIKAPSGALVPLSAVATVTQDRGFALISRVDGRRTVTIQGLMDTEIANANEVLADTRVRFLPELEERFPRVKLEMEGQRAESEETMGSMQRNFLIGLVGVFLLLSFQFKSYIEPFTIMLAIPMGLIGVIWGHFFQGLELSMPSMMGMGSLAGVVVNDTILLVEFIKQGRRDGLSAEEAAVRASRQRFRAIFLTSVTTVAGLTPLLLETSLQAQVLIPLATSLAFGLTSATILSLLLIPAAYCILDDFGLTVPRHVLHGKGLAHHAGHAEA